LNGKLQRMCPPSFSLCWLNSQSMLMPFWAMN
jgi:hypothetical protein